MRITFEIEFQEGVGWGWERARGKEGEVKIMYNFKDV